MVCDRCRKSIGDVLDGMKVPYGRIDLGEVELVSEADEKFVESFKEKITPLGFELIEDRNSRIISKIKSTIIEDIRSGKKVNVSDYHSQSTLFSSVEGITIEQFYIRQKIEYVKELLTYDELSLSEISYRLNYSSVQHLSNQFKKVTGLTPSHFKSIGHSRRLSIDQI